MLGRLVGTLVEKSPPEVLVDVGCVGYEVDVPMSTFYNLPAVGAPVTLLTHFVVRDDAQLLYGFGSAEERAAFRELIRISGVGPRTALGILSGLSVVELAQAVAAYADPDVTLLSAGRVKHMTRGMNEVLARHFADVHATLGQHKARGLVATRPRPGPSSYPRSKRHDDLDLVGQLGEHDDLVVRGEAGQYARGVHVVNELAAELQIELAAELGAALRDMAGLHPQVLVPVESDAQCALLEAV